MKHVMVRYSVKKDKVDAVKKEIVEFVNAIKRHEPYTTYDAYQENETSFVHFMVFKDDRSETLHNDAGYTNRFMDFLYACCEKEPIFTGLRLVSTTKQEHNQKW